MRRLRLPRTPSPRKRIKWARELLLESIKRFRKDLVYRLRVVLYAGAVAIVLVLVISVAIPASSGSKFCGSCHSMKENYRSHQRSAHSRVTCYACHEPPSFMVILTVKTLIAPKDIWEEITKTYHDPINHESHLSTEMPSEWCFRCHSPGTREFTLTGLVVNHWLHEKEGLNCTFCHNRVAHDIEGYKNRLEEKYCFDCHIAEKVEKAMPENCRACHKSAKALL